MAEPSPQVQHLIRRFHAIGFAARVVLLLVALGLNDAYLCRHLGVSVGIYVFFALLTRTGKWNLLSALLVAEWLYFVRTGFVYFGWQCGFSLHYAAASLFPLLLDHHRLKTRVVLAAIPAAVHLPLLVLVPPWPAKVAISPAWQKALFGLNSLLFLLFATGVIVRSLRSLAEEKRRAERLADSRTRLIANMSHELKTPLAAMLTTLQGTLARSREPEYYRETLGVLERNIRGLGLLVRRMLDFVSAEDVALKIERRPIDLRELLRGCAAELEPVATAGNVQLALDAPQAWPIESDPVLLAIVFRNLLANAIRYSPGGGTVRVVLAAHTDFTPRVVVRDEGPGIAPEVLPHIFDPFFRGERARSREENAFGLGLAIVAEYVALLGWRVDVDTAPGRGTAFVVSMC